MNFSYIKYLVYKRAFETVKEYLDSLDKKKRNVKVLYGSLMSEYDLLVKTAQKKFNKISH